MKKTIASLFAVLALSCAVSAAAIEAGKAYEPFEANYPTYVLSDDSAASPQPFEANYPVQITGLQLAPVQPSYVLVCSNVTPAPFEDCYPVFKR